MLRTPPSTVQRTELTAGACALTPHTAVGCFCGDAAMPGVRPRSEVGKTNEYAWTQIRQLDYGRKAMYVSRTYRKQLNNTYKEFEDYIHKASALGFNFAISYKF